MLGELYASGEDARGPIVRRGGGFVLDGAYRELALGVVIGLVGAYAYILVYISRVGVRGGGWPKERSGYSVDLP